jgi:hypothetical protein
VEQSYLLLRDCRTERLGRFGKNLTMRFVLLTTISFYLFTTAAMAAAMMPATADVLARGKYLALAGDCMASHTAKGGALFAGDREINTPFGTMSSPNITPDQKQRALRLGHFSEMVHTLLHSRPVISGVR